MQGAHSVLFLLLFFSTFCFGQTITVSDISELDNVSHLIPEPFVLQKCTYDTDIAFGKDEFFYLIGLVPGTQITTQDVQKGLFYLFKKNKFSSITLTRDDDELHVSLSSFWTVQKVKIHGIWFGSDEYKTMYLMEPGDRFDPERHKHSIQRIKDRCYQEGFLSTQVESYFDHDHNTKSITVHLTINIGKKATIKESVVTLQSDEPLSTEESTQLTANLEKQVKKVLNKSYHKELLKGCRKKIKRELLEKGYCYSTVSLQEKLNEKKDVALSWEVFVHQKRSFSFAGNHFFSSSQLLDRIMQFGRSATLLPSSLIVQELTQLYKDHGFWRVKVASDEQKHLTHFAIDEQQRATISGVTLHNVKRYAPLYVLKKCCGPVRHYAFAEKKQINQALDRLTSWYARRGFLDVKIINSTFELLDEKKQYYQLHISLEEGDRCFLKKVIIPEYDELLQEGPFTVGAHIIFTAPMMQAQQQWLQEHFRSQGYLQPSIKPVFEREGNGILITWHIIPGNKIVTGKTVMTGSSHIPFTIINREACYREGDVWNREALRKTFKRLKETDTFDAIQLAPAPDAWDQVERPILVTIQKDEPFEIRLRAGLELEQIRQWQSFTGVSYRVGGSFIVKSPFDRADQLRFDGDFASKHREIIARYQVPWLWSVPVKTTAQAYSIKHDQGFLGIKKDVYNVHQNGVLLGLFKKISNADLGLNIGFEWMKTSINSSEAQTPLEAIQISDALNFEPALLNRQVPFVFFEPTVLLNFLDNKVYPTKGWFSLCSLKGMFPVTPEQFDSYFVRLLVEQKLFFPLKALVTVLRVRFGHIFHQDFRAIMPNERFYLGGVNSLRSYDTDLAPPLGCFVDPSNCKEHVVPQGGKSMVNANIEVRLSLFDKGGIALFQDFGFLSSNTFADFEVEKILAGTGFGVWYKTPVGPIRFDIAWKWSTIERFERPYAWFLTLGQSF